MRQGRRDGLKEEGTIIADESAVGKPGGLDRRSGGGAGHLNAGGGHLRRSPLFTIYPVVFISHDTAGALPSSTA